MLQGEAGTAHRGAVGAVALWVKLSILAEGAAQSHSRMSGGFVSLLQCHMSEHRHFSQLHSAFQTLFLHLDLSPSLEGFESFVDLAFGDMV